MINYADDIKHAVPMTEAAAFYGFEPNRSGFICCPFHGEKTPSCKVYDGDRGWHCYGCGEGGSVIDFVEKYFGLNFNGAIAKINEDFRLGLPIGEKLDRRKQIEAGRAAFRRRQELAQHQKRLQELDDAYWQAFTVWQAYDADKRNYKPQNESDELHPLYVEALKKIDYAAYLVDQAEKARDEYVRQYNRARAAIHGQRLPEHERTI